jgi:tRNA(Ile)-lysidine synthase
MLSLSRYDRLLVGFSGGLDSTVLLHALFTSLYANRVTAIHVHHGLNTQADAWENHCQTLSDKWGIPLIVRRVTINADANVEEQARLARLGVFASLLTERDALLLAHHADDQAETLLLNLMRGAGIDGLSAMPAQKDCGAGVLIRPFLKYSRSMLKTYASMHQLSWVDDSSNQDDRFSRNYIRHQVMPLLVKKWPQAVAHINSSATHCQEARVQLNVLAELDAGSTSIANDTLDCAGFMDFDHARIRNILRLWLRHNQVPLPSKDVLQHLIMDVLFATEDATPTVSWRHVVVRRYQQTLYLSSTRSLEPMTDIVWTTFPEPQPLGNTSKIIHAVPMSVGIRVKPTDRVMVRFRTGGEKIRLNGQTKTLKQLFQAWKVPPWQRQHVPLVYINGTLSSVIGFAINEDCLVTDGTDAYQFF